MDSDPMDSDPMDAGWLHPPLAAVREVVARALAEDLTPLGDLTSALLDRTDGEARIVAREPGRLAGTRAATEVFAQLDPDVSIVWSAGEGARLSAGQVVATLSGPFPSILTGERSALNLLGHLSGIATLTERYVRAAAAVGARTHLGHPQDHARPAGAGEGRSACRWRPQPPRQPVGLDARQGQPPRRGVRHRGGASRSGPVARANGARRVRLVRAVHRGGRGRRRRGPARQHAPRPGARLRRGRRANARPTRRAARCSRCPAGSPSTRSGTTPRPGST